MLNILLLILKIIGIVLLVILGILVLLICMVLFNGIKYEAMGKCDGSMDSLAGKASFSWLFHLIEGEVLIRNDIFRWKIRIAWLKFSGPPESAQAVEKEVEQEAEKVGKEAEEFVEEEAEEFEAEVAEEPDKIKTEIHETEEKAESIAEEARSDIEDAVGSVENREDTKEQDREEDQETGDGSGTGEYTETGPDNSAEGSTERRPGILKIITDFFKAVLDAIREFFLTIREFLLSFLEAVKEQAEAAQVFINFLRSTIHREAFKKIWDEVVWLVKKIRPKLDSLKLKYGFDDPCLTGEVLAGLGALYPFLGDNAIIYPDFEERTFRGNIDMKGKVRLWYILLAALRLLFNKNVRQTYTDMMQMMNP